MSWQLKRLPSLMIAALAALWLAAMPAWAESTFDQIKRTGELHYGAIDYPPNWFRDKTTGKWQGFLVEVAEDVAKEMGVKAVPVETTWATCVLDLQANKTDVQFGLQATPKRALAIDFAGPVYNLYWYAINHKGFEAKNWEDYNKPEVKIAAMLGNFSGNRRPLFPDRHLTTIPVSRSTSECMPKADNGNRIEELPESARREMLKPFRWSII